MDLNKLLKTQWDRAAAIGFSALGALFLLLGWIGVSGTPYLAEQAPYIVSGGIGGLFLLGLGGTLWISADLRDEWRKLDRIEEALGEGTLRWVEEATPAVPAPRAVRSAEPVAAPVSTHVIELDPVLPLPVDKAARSTTGAKPAAAARTRRPAARPRVKASTNDA